MKNIITATFLTLFLILPCIIHADEITGTPAENEYNHFIGLAASSISGVGASYGYRFIPGYMIKICGMYFESRDKNSYDGYEYYTEDIWWNCGAEIQRNFFSINTGSMDIEGYCLAGGSYWFDKFKDPVFPEGNDESKNWVAGVALGARLILFERVAINLDLGYQYSRDIDDSERYTGIAGGCAAHYLF